jgi:glycine dehydrogenase subunit 1
MAYLPNSDADRQAMLEALGATSQADLFSSVPARLLDPPLDLPPPLGEQELVEELQRLAGLNRPLGDFHSFLGAGGYSFPPSSAPPSRGRSSTPPTRPTRPRRRRGRCRRSSSSSR